MTIGPELRAKVTAVTTALESSSIPYAIGGALSYGFHAEPRGTADIDVDIFLPPDRGGEVLDALASIGVSADHIPNAVSLINESGQIRALLGDTYVDLFFSHHEFFADCDRRALTVPWEGHQIRILAVEDITVFKVLFNRARDWADIEQLLYANAAEFDLEYATTWLAVMLGEDSRIDRLRQLHQHAIDLTRAEQPPGSAAP